MAGRLAASPLVTAEDVAAASGLDPAGAAGLASRLAGAGVLEGVPGPAGEAMYAAPGILRALLGGGGAGCAAAA